MMTPALVAISHGTSSTAGQAAVRGLVRAVENAVRIPDSKKRDNPPGSTRRSIPTVRLGHIDVEQPDVAATLASLATGEPAVIVPLLLSAGYHVYHDLAAERAAAEHPATVTERPPTTAERTTAEPERRIGVGSGTGRRVSVATALGPDERLATVLAQRLQQAGATEADTVVLAVAGSSDRRAVADCREMSRMLSNVMGQDIRLGFLAAATPLVPKAVRDAHAERPGRRVIVSTYLLAPGYFHDLARSAGADVTTEPLLTTDSDPPQELVDIVLERYATASRRV